MKVRIKWFLGFGALAIIGALSFVAFALTQTKSPVELADSGPVKGSVESLSGSGLAEVVRVREFIKTKNIYLTESEVNRLSMAFIDASRKHEVDLWLLLSVAASESHFRADAISRVGCIGIMQLKPSTARSLGVDPARLYDPIVNIDTGTRYLKQLIDKYDDIYLAVAAYNAGPSRVSTAIPQIRETKQYVARVSNKHNELIGTARPNARTAE